MFECTHRLEVELDHNMTRAIKIDQIGKIIVRKDGTQIIPVDKLNNDILLGFDSIFVPHNKSHLIPIDELVKLNPFIKVEWIDIDKEQQPAKLQYFKREIEKFTDLFDELEELRKQLPSSGYKDLLWYYLGKSKFQLILAFSSMCGEKD
jgi:hypothetical protein